MSQQAKAFAQSTNTPYRVTLSNPQGHHWPADEPVAPAAAHPADNPAGEAAATVPSYAPVSGDSTSLPFDDSTSEHPAIAVNDPAGDLDIPDFLR